MKPLGTESHNALSRPWTKRMRKAGKGKGRQEDRRVCEDELEAALADEEEAG